ncbi:MAG: response regulator transcription factor [Anaerococcus sp.]|nr:response regulator transcription factor [Anaerococcus sp.]
MKILLIDDEMLFSLGLKTLLEQHDEFSDITIYKDVDNIKSFLENNFYDLILIKIDLKNISEKSGFSVAIDIKSICPKQKIVLLTYYNRPIYEFRAIELGASGYIEKNISKESLIYTLIDIASGTDHFNEIVINKDGHILKLREYDEVISILTPREMELLKLIRAGSEIKEISKNLEISQRTISNHLNHIYAKLGVCNRYEAVLKAVELGYFDQMSK